MNEYEISLKRRLDARSIQATKERLETELQQSRQELQQNKEKLDEKDKIIQEMQSRYPAIIDNLKKQGFSIEQIVAITNFDLALVSKAYNQED